MFLGVHNGVVEVYILGYDTMLLSNGINYPVMWHRIPEDETSVNDHISSRISYRSMILKVQIAQLLVEDIHCFSRICKMACEIHKNVSVNLCNRLFLGLGA
jgi:hypothetical protein